MDDSTLQFAYPVWIWIGLPLVVLGVLVFLRSDRRRRADLDKLAHPRFHARLVAGWSPALRWTRRVLWLSGLLGLTLAAARPQVGYEWREVKRRGIDILFAVDTSRSMLAEDLVPNRLERARLGIIDFLERLEADRVGLIPFAGTAFALCPLTLDYDAFRESLNIMSTDLIPQQGTDLASAIHEADRLFDAEENNQRFLVLITDGEDLEGEALEAAEESAKLGTIIYTVGVGAADGQRIPVRDRYGRQSFLKDENGEEVKTKLDAATLEKIADVTGGLYVPLGRGAEGLDAIYQKRLALAPKSELAQQLEKVPLERFQWPLGVAILLLIFQAVLGERKIERKRKALVSVARRVRPAAVFMLALGLTLTAVRADVVAEYNGGTEAYSKGEFEEAVEKLKGSLSTSDLSLQKKAYYNLGNSLYRIGQGTMQEDAKKTIETWEKSLKAYDDSLALDDSDEDARYNREFVKKQLDQLKEQEGQPQDQENQDGDEESKPEDSKNEPQDGQDPQQGEDGEEKDGEQEPSENGEEGDGEKGEKPSAGDESKDQKGEEDSSEGDQGDEAESKDEQEAGEEESTDEQKGIKGQEEKQPEENEKPTGKPGEAREDAKDGSQEGDGAVAQPGKARKAGEMSREEAIRLLETLGDDERVVIPVPLSERNRKRQQERGAKRKTW